jgi:hypothetical protein
MLLDICSTSSFALIVILATQICTCVAILSEDAIYTLQPNCQRSSGNSFESPFPLREPRTLAAERFVVNDQKKLFSLFLFSLGSSR